MSFESNLPSALARYLSGNQVRFEVISHPEEDSALQAARCRGIPLGKLAKTIMLRDRHGFIMAVYPADRTASLEKIRSLTGRDMDYAAQAEYAPLFEGIDVAVLPPVGFIYGVDTLVDTAFSLDGDMYLESGVRATLVRLDPGEFHKLITGAILGEISDSLVAEKKVTPKKRRGLGLGAGVPVVRGEHLRERFEQALPDLRLPLLNQRLCAFMESPDAVAEDLVPLLAETPDIAGILIQMAQSTLFGGPLPEPTLRAAVNSLGLEATAGFAAGFNLNLTFRPRSGGPLGHMGFWRQAIYCSATLYLMTRQWPREEQWQAYLAGLLHNFGYLLLGHLDVECFQQLNRLIMQAPDRDVHEIESLLLGESHCVFGARLTQVWDLPESITVAICEHHNELYQGRHHKLVNAILIANRLLKRHGIGDARRVLIPNHLLMLLETDIADLNTMIDQVLDHCRFLDDLARHLSVAEIS